MQTDRDTQDARVYKAVAWSGAIGVLLGIGLYDDTLAASIVLGGGFAYCVYAKGVELYADYAARKET